MTIIFDDGDDNGTDTAMTNEGCDSEGGEDDVDDA